MSKTERWIVIPNWDKFQHYTDRTPPWIKTYTAELLNSEAYLDLPLATRGVLHGLWMHYALARGVVPASTGYVSRVLHRRVSNAQLARLNNAGFIAIVASKPLALARSREGLLRKPQSDERRSPRKAAASRQNRNPPSPDTGTEITYAEYLAALENGDAQAADEAKP